MKNGTRPSAPRITNGACEDSMITVFNVIDIFSYTFFYIALIFIGYILCDSAVVAYSITVLFSEDDDSELLSFLDNAIEVTYSYLLPLVLVSTIERLAATCLVKKYENMRPWRFVAASQIICLSFIGCCYIFYKEYFGGNLSSYMIIACEICIYIVVSILLLINQRRTRFHESYNFTKLSCRYQLAENIRACRFLLTIVLFDSLVTSTDIVADVGFSFESEFEPDRCNESNYLPTFAFLKILSMVFELAIPCALTTVGHESYRKRLRALLLPRSTQTVPANFHNQIRNVLGQQVLTSHTTDQYFSRLSNSWDAVAPITKY